MWAVFFFCWLGGAASAQPGINVYDHLNEAAKPKWEPDEIVVKFKPDVPKERISQINLGHKTAILFKGPYEKFHRLRIPLGKTVEEIVDAYRKNPNVEYAEPNVMVYALFQPNDPFFPNQWHLDNNTSGGINIKAAWDIQKGDPVVIVAVIDTGIAYELYGSFRKAPDFANTTFVPGYNFVNNTTHANDDNSHGTHVAGTIAQSTNNGLGVAGVAFNAALMPVKVLDKNGSGTATNVANGIYFAADHGAKVINLSLGSSQASLTIKNALAYAYSKGVTIVCAAGNEFNSGNPPSYPAAFDEYCIAVGATRFDETRSYYSSTGSYLDIAAPGGDTSVNQSGDGYADGILQQTFNPNTKNPADFGYWFFQGTSMATPHVAGVAALLISKGTMGPDNVRAALQSTAKDKGPPGWDPEYGAGIVNALAALQYSRPCPRCGRHGCEFSARHCSGRNGQCSGECGQPGHGCRIL
jgi:serine protease